MRTRSERRELRNRKITRREMILQFGGERQGVLFDKHVNKIKNTSSGYLSKSGTLLHYANGTNKDSIKVRDRRSYNGTTNWGHRDQLRINDMDMQEKEYSY